MYLWTINHSIFIWPHCLWRNLKHFTYHVCTPLISWQVYVLYATACEFVEWPWMVQKSLPCSDAEAWLLNTVLCSSWILICHWFHKLTYVHRLKYRRYVSSRNQQWIEKYLSNPTLKEKHGWDIGVIVSCLMNTQQQYKQLVHQQNNSAWNDTKYKKNPSQG